MPTGAFSRTFSRVKITYNPQYTTVTTFYRAIEKPVDLFEKLGVKRYFKIYLLALKTRYRHRGKNSTVAVLYPKHAIT